MRYRLLLTAVAAVAICGACGDVDTRTAQPAPTTSSTAAPTTTTTTMDWDALARWVAAAEEANTPAPTTAPKRQARATNNGGTGTGTCGGDLPPCYVMMRESRGQADAYNPTGCGGRGCYGKWQFDPNTWNATARAMGRGDLVGNAAGASAADQDAVARHLWDGGAGCGHWAAC